MKKKIQILYYLSTSNYPLITSIQALTFLDQFLRFEIFDRKYNTAKH